MPLKLGKGMMVPKSRCMHCGYSMDCAASVDPDKTDLQPTPGAFTICIKCGHVMVFDSALMLRNLTEAEAVMIAGDRRIIAIQRARMSLDWDSAHLEDAIREFAKSKGRIATQEQIDNAVRGAFALLAKGIKR